MAVTMHVDVSQGILFCEFEKTTIRVHTAVRNRRRLEPLKWPNSREFKYQLTITCEGVGFAWLFAKAQPWLANTPGTTGS